MRRVTSLIAAAVITAAAGAPQADAANQSPKKSMWGPVVLDGASQFPIYRDLGVGIFQMQLRWDVVAPSRPADARDPYDPTYQWPGEVAYALAQAKKYHIEVAMQLQGSPSWANGGRSWSWAPRREKDFADFAEAAARRYPSIKHWLIWGEPSRDGNWRPLQPERRGKPLGRRQAAAPRRYARLLDVAYSRLKSVSRRNLVVGGNTFTTGDISPRNFIENMRLPNGRPPRMDLYGHNPFTAREPDLGKPPLGNGLADFSDLDTLAKWVDRYLGRKAGKRRRIRLFLSEFFAPTDHENHEFNFYVTRETQARWLRSALRIARSWDRIYTLGWYALYDDPLRPAGDEVNRGLIDRQGTRKPAYYAYRDG